MKCAMYRLFHKLKAKVVTSLFFFMMILFSESHRKKVHRRNYLQLPTLNTKGSSQRQWTRQKSPKTKCHCSYQWQSWTLSLFLILKSRIKSSEGSSQVGSQLQILWSGNHWMTLSNLPISEQAKFWKRCGRIRSFMSYDPLVPSLSSFLLFSPLHPPMLPAGQQKGWRAVSLLLKPGCQRPQLFHSVPVEHLILLIINSVLCKA